MPRRRPSTPPDATPGPDRYLSRVRPSWRPVATTAPAPVPVDDPPPADDGSSS